MRTSVALLLGLLFLAACDPGLLESDEPLVLDEGERAAASGKKPPPAEPGLEVQQPPPTRFPGGAAGVSPQQGGQTCGAVATVNAVRFITGDPGKLDEATVVGWRGAWTSLPGGIERWGASTRAVERALLRASEEVGGFEVERVSLSGVDHEARWERVKRELQAGNAVAASLRWGPKNAHWLVFHQLHSEGGHEFVAHAQAGSLGWIEKSSFLQELYYNYEGQWWGDGDRIVVVRRTP